MKYIQLGIYLLFVLSCNKQVSNNEIAPQNKLNKTKYVFKNPITFDSLKIQGFFMENYKFNEIPNDVLNLNYVYMLYPNRTLIIKPDKLEVLGQKTEKKYLINKEISDNISDFLYLESPKSYDDFNPPLPITTYPEIYATFYKKNSVISKQFLIAHDSIDYSDDFYKVIDFLYILQIKNIQNEDTKSFIKNYKW